MQESKFPIRLEPLGAAAEKTFEVSHVCIKCVNLEEEKEFLQSSLFALTTHFAQVQFRLRQVASAPFDEQESLIKELEEFAFKDVNLQGENDRFVDEIKEIRNKQKELIQLLKFQLKELRMLEQNSEMNWSILIENLRVKEDLEKQLRTQIEDLEQFVQFLKEKCSCKQQRITFLNLIEKSCSFLQMLAFFHFRFNNCFKVYKKESKHWGDLRAKLELAIIELKHLLQGKKNKEKITTTVRKNLATSIRDLMQHGTKAHYVTPLFDYCSQPLIHSWDIILYYYHFKKGDEYNSSTFQTLSRSFNISLAGVSPKKNLLCVIEEIVSTHSKYKRSQDSQFRAFICAALNAKRLVNWLDVIFHCGRIIETFYYPWSYVATTRYQDGLRSLDVLTPYKFNLPVDLEVKKFQSEDEVFV